MVKIAGCAGHAGFGVTPGKRTPDGEYEWDFNNKVILAFEETLYQYENVEFLRTDDRTGKTDVPLSTRTNKANSWGADFYISFHENANTGKWGNWGGTETLTYLSGKSLEIGKLIHAAQLKVYGLRDRGVKDGSDLWIIRKTNMPSALLEGAFMDSTTDIVKLRDDNVLRNVGCEVAHVVAKYYGLKKKVIAQPTLTAVDASFTDKVTVPNTAFWQARALVQEYQKRGFKCYILQSHPHQEQGDNSPAPFVVETDFNHANSVKMELHQKGYTLAVWESI
jgi:N-acetylmuramoyl-L-alanine amidase